MGEMLSSLFSVPDLNIPEDKWLQFYQAINYTVENVRDDSNMSSFNVQEKHNYTIIYNTAVTSYPVLAYISGYVARKASRFTKYSICLDPLKMSKTFSRDILI